jgi:hypothetical protein
LGGKRRCLMSRPRTRGFESIPDRHECPLPPGLGSFPIYRAEEYADRLPASWLDGTNVGTGLNPPVCRHAPRGGYTDEGQMRGRGKFGGIQIHGVRPQARNLPRYRTEQARFRFRCLSGPPRDGNRSGCRWPHAAEDLSGRIRRRHLGCRGIWPRACAHRRQHDVSRNNGVSTPSTPVMARTYGVRSALVRSVRRGAR